MANRSTRSSDLYDVECILDDRLDCGITTYLVKWKGYETPTWQPKDHLVNCDEVLFAYKSVSTFILFLCLEA